MRNILFIIFIALISSCFNQSKIKEAISVTKITIRSVDINIETPLAIRCSDFEKYFSEIQTKNINDPVQINKITSLINKLQPATEEYSRNADTRIKLEFFYNNDSIESICMDRLVVERNNSAYINNDSLINLLTSPLN